MGVVSWLVVSNAHPTIIARIHPPTHNHHTDTLAPLLPGAAVRSLDNAG
ncbi:hypothetical protein [Phormidesmis priestleyi]|nr:hypothetical protein [Phormidesmis priestleyi]